jgi:Cu-Zn family superoxide dismutase
MKAHVVTLTVAIVAAGAAYAASETVTMNAIDANGVG